MPDNDFTPALVEMAQRNIAKADLIKRLRAMANDLHDSKGKTMDRWDEIRHQVETHKGSDLPRLNFEGMIEDFADLFVEAADALANAR